MLAANISVIAADTKTQNYCLKKKSPSFWANRRSSNCTRVVDPDHRSNVSLPGLQDPRGISPCICSRCPSAVPALDMAQKPEKQPQKQGPAPAWVTVTQIDKPTLLLQLNLAEHQGAPKRCGGTPQALGVPGTGAASAPSSLLSRGWEDVPEVSPTLAPPAFASR